MSFRTIILGTVILLLSGTTAFAQTRSNDNNYRILYIFPHPDDESYGPAAAIDKDLKAGNEVHLLTLTKGGATRMRHELNLSVEEMGEVRYKEMLNVEKALGLTSMTVHDFPDGGLKEVDIRELEKVIKKHIMRIKPHVLVTYPVHGISTHNDHIVCHAAVKRVFLELRENNNYLRRLAFFGLTQEDNEAVPVRDFKTITEQETDCVVKFTPDNVKKAHQSLDCYVTYQPMIEESRIKKAFTKSLSFDFFQESFNPPVSSLTDRLGREK